jgi:hypothetical protein
LGNKGATLRFGLGDGVQLVELGQVNGRRRTNGRLTRRRFYLQVNLIIYRWGANHQRFHWRMNRHNGMVLSGREAAKFTRADGDTTAVHLHYQTTAQDDKAFVAVQMFMRPFALADPTGVGMVIPDLQMGGLKPHLIRRRGTGE